MGFGILSHALITSKKSYSGRSFQVIAPVNKTCFGSLLMLLAVFGFSLAKAPTTLNVTATAYTSHPSQTDSTPFITATGARTRLGVIAVSRDLLDDLPYGSRVKLQDLSGGGGSTACSATGCLSWKTPCTRVGATGLMSGSPIMAPPSASG